MHRTHLRLPFARCRVSTFKWLVRATQHDAEVIEYLLPRKKLRIYRFKWIAINDTKQRMEKITSTATILRNITDENGEWWGCDRSIAMNRNLWTEHSEWRWFVACSRGECSSNATPASQFAVRISHRPNSGFGWHLKIREVFGWYFSFVRPVKMTVKANGVSNIWDKQILHSLWWRRYSVRRSPFGPFDGKYADNFKAPSQRSLLIASHA